MARYIRYFLAGVAALFATSATAAQETEDGLPLPRAKIVDACVEEQLSLYQSVEPCLGKIFEACPGSAGSTAEMRDCTALETQYWDRRLNRVYGELRSLLKEGDSAEDNPDGFVLADDLRTAQRAWIAWRDAKCAYEGKSTRGGTIGTLLAGACVMDITARRAFELEQQLALQSM